MKRRRVAIVASHVIQYQDPFFRLLAADPKVDLTVLYCSTAGARMYRDEDMGTALKWDVEILSGYRHVFLHNLVHDSNRGWTRHINPGIVPVLLRGRYEMAIFMLGWGSVSALLGILTCRLAGIPFFLYGDSSFPPPETTMRRRVRARMLRFLFRNTTGFMVSGALNADYYRHYGADPGHFFLLPWAVDNERFAEASRFAPEEREEMRERFGIRPGQAVFVFSAKLVERKDPMTLLRAFEQIPDRDRAAVLFLGDGVLRQPLETYAREHGLPNAHFAGFVNQSELPKYYGMSDVFVLPSIYEPRGAVINEAMACGLPVIVTDRCGSIGDIVLEGENAFIYPAGDAASLAASMARLINDKALRERMARRSVEIIGAWTFQRGVEGVKAALDHIGGSNPS
ncbi:MAG TPA: glycosyltransferase [Thermoanaerobaculia bacterium]|nr:glycosyltransferase [Thermoanaerobaculia bacterium]